MTHVLTVWPSAETGSRNLWFQLVPSYNALSRPAPAVTTALVGLADMFTQIPRLRGTNKGEIKLPPCCLRQLRFGHLTHLKLYFDLNSHQCLTFSLNELWRGFLLISRTKTCLLLLTENRQKLNTNTSQVLFAHLASVEMATKPVWQPGRQRP